MFSLEVKDLAAQLEIGIRQRFGNAPLEAVNQSVDDSVELHRGTVAAENELAVLLVEMVEDREKDLGGTRLTG